MKQFFTALFLFFLTFGVNAQNYTVKGTLLDEQGAALPSASVFLLTKIDSTLTQFTSTDVNGNFEFKSVPKGDHIIQSSFVGFITNYKAISALGDNKTIVLETITMKENNQLGELTVEAEVIPIVIKKDTVEYNAAAFKVKPNDVTEDLLKKLPGVQVDKEGNIKAQGENVDRVLVNGKEFFGDDPKVTTKNLPAGTVKKVQVYNRKSDQSELSGIDDGENYKTINIELKDDAKVGVFGNVSAGEGFNGTDNVNTFDRYEFSANVSKFTDKTQFSFLGQLNNVNKQGFSFSDYVSFLGGFNNVQAELGGNMWNFNSNGASVPLSSGGSGLSDAAAGGINLSHDFSKNTKIASSYFYSYYKNNLTQNTFTENFLNEGSFESGSDSKRETVFGAHNVNLRFDHKVDSTQTFRVRGRFKLNDGEIINNSSSYTNNTSNLPQNTSTTDYTSTSKNLSYSGSVLHSYKFKKVGRVMSTNLSLSSSDNDRPLDILSTNGFYNYNPDFFFEIPLNQKQTQTQTSFNYDGKITYTEPLGKKRYGEISYERANNNYNSLNEFIDILPNGEFVKNTSLSTNYTNDYFYDNVGLSLRQVRTKYNLTVGVEGQQSQLKGVINDTTHVGKTFQNILPRLNLRYNITSSKNIMMRYRTNFNAPSLNQLQPVQNNTNPLSIYLGNQDLRGEYTHSLYTHFLSFSQFSGTSFYANLNGNYTTNKITNSTEILDNYVRVTQPINVDYNMNVSSYISFSSPVKLLKAKVNISTNNGYTNSIVFVNGTKDLVDRYNYGVDFSIENAKKDIVDIMAGVEFSQNVSQYDISTSFNQVFYSTTYFTSIDIDLKKWTLNTNFDMNIYSGQAFATNQIIPLWNAYISRFVFEANRGEIRLAAYDILNQNIGFSRYADLNYIQQEKSNNLARYVMLSFTYKLNKMENPNEMKGMRWGRRR